MLAADDALGRRLSAVTTSGNFDTPEFRCQQFSPVAIQQRSSSSRWPVDRYTLKMQDRETLD